MEKKLNDDTEKQYCSRYSNNVYLKPSTEILRIKQRSSLVSPTIYNLSAQNKLFYIGRRRTTSLNENDT